MINVSQNVINACNSDSVTHREYIVIDNQKVIVKANLSDDTYNEGNFIGTFIMKKLEFETENDIDYKQKEFVYYKEVNGESFKIGTFIVTEVSINDTEETVKVTAYDYTLKFANPYVTELNYTGETITMQDVLQEICEKVGIELENTETITNGDFVVDSNQFNETGVQFGNVIQAIAQMSGNFAKVNQNDKLEFIFNKETDEIIEDYEELDDKRDTRPITIVSLGMEGVDGANVDLRWEEGIKLYGENYLIINDNPFAYNTEKRLELIQAIFDKVKGFGYSSFESKSVFKPYLQCGDLVKLRNKAGELINSIVLRISTEGHNMTISAPSVIDATVKYSQPADIVQRMKKTEFELNREKQKISTIIEDIGDREGKNTSITQDLDSIETAVKQVADIYNTVTGSKSIKLENCMEGELQYLQIKGNNAVFENDSLIKVYSPNLKIEPNESYLDETGTFVNSISQEYGNIIVEVSELKSLNIISSTGAIYQIATFSKNPLEYEGEEPLVAEQFEIITDSETERELIPQEKYLVICYYKDEYDIAYDSIEIRRNNKTIDLGITEKLRLFSSEIYDEFIYDANVNSNKAEGEELEPKAKVIRRVGENEDGSLYVLPIAIEEPLQIEDIILTENTNTIEIINYSAEMFAKFVILNDFTSKFGSTYQVETAIKQLSNSVLIIAKEMVGKENVLSSINVAIKDGLGILEIINNSMIIQSDNFKMSADGTITITAKINEKYKYSSADIYLALLHIKGTITLPNELVELYRCVSTTPNKITMADVTKMQAISKGNAEPVKDIAGTLSIDPSDTEKGISFNLNNNKDSDLQTIIGLYQIYTYMIKGSYLYLGGGYSEELNEMTYGIHLDGIKKMLRIIDVNNLVGTIIDAGKLDTYNLYGANGGAKGKAMHSPDVEFGGNDHDYMCHYTGSALVFNIDSNSGTDFNVGPFWINTSTSDERLKDNIASINENLLKAIKEIELKQFTYKMDSEGKIYFGIIAQELLEICKNYNVNLFEYNIIKQGAFMPKDNNLYYAIDKTELLLLKTKVLENNYNNLLKRIEKLENLML